MPGNVGHWLLMFSLSATLAAPVMGQQCETTHELMGFTSATFTGDQGVLSFTLACQAEFGSETRMCPEFALSLVPRGCRFPR